MDEKRSLLSGTASLAVPVDRWNLAYWMLFLQGFGTLLPWNMFITAYAYFQYKFRNTSYSNNFENYFEVVSMIPNVTFLCLNMVFKHRVSLRQRLVYPVSVMFACFILTSILIYVDTFSWQTGFFAITLVTAFIVNAASAVYQSGVFGLAAFLPEGRYTQAVMSGQGFGGLFSSIANILALAAGHDAQSTAIGYFLSATVVLLVCLVSTMLMPRMRFVHHHMDQQEKGITKSYTPSINDLMDEKESSDIQQEFAAKKREMPKLLTIFKKIYVLALSAGGIFFVTLAVFPAVTQSIESTVKSQFANKNPHLKIPPWNDKYFTALTCFLLFNAGDYVGRTIPSMIVLFEKRSIAVLTIIRFAFIPLFALCNSYPSSRTAPVVFDNDVWPIVFMWLLAVSNGYLSSLCMMQAPGLVQEHEQETVGTMMAFCLGLGLASGAGFSFLIKYIVDTA